MTDSAPERTAPARAWRVVLDKIEGDLLEGRLGPGDRLQPERELAATLGVGRSSVRGRLRVMGGGGRASELAKGHGMVIGRGWQELRGGTHAGTAQGDGALRGPDR